MPDVPPENGFVLLEWGAGVQVPPVHEPTPVGSWFLGSLETSPAAPASVTVAVPVFCRAACRLTLQLSVPKALLQTAGARATSRAIIGARSFALSAANEGTAVIKLNAAGKRLLSRRRRVVARLSVVLSSSRGPQATASVSLKTA